jgi:hypothetical protein
MLVPTLCGWGIETHHVVAVKYVEATEETEEYVFHEMGVHTNVVSGCEEHWLVRCVDGNEYQLEHSPWEVQPL